MPVIRLTSYSISSGTASFLIGNNRYYYNGLHEADVRNVVSLSNRKQPGKALNVAKAGCQFWKLNDGGWHDKNEPEPPV